MLSVLIISPWFAPYGGVGALRMTSLASYLSERHAVTVLAFSNSFYDPSLCTAAVPEGIEVVRVEKVSERRLYSLALKSTLGEMLKRRRFDLCICTVGPYDVMYMMQSLRRLVPHIILDYRDSWVFNCFDLTLKRRALNAFYSRIERRAFNTIDRIVCVSEGQERVIREQYKLPDGLTCVIRNGFDEALLLREPGQVGRICSDDAEIIAISGKCAYYDSECGDELLKALKQLNRDGRKVQLIHLGQHEPVMREYARSHGLEDRDYRQLGFLPYRRSVEVLQQASALVLPYSSQVGLGTKVYDYIAVDKPILVVQRGASELKQFVSSFPNGFSVEPNADDIHDVLARIIDDGIRRLGVSDVESYSRRESNMQYERLIESVCKLDASGSAASNYIETK